MLGLVDYSGTYPTIHLFDTRNKECSQMCLASRYTGPIKVGGNVLFMKSIFWLLQLGLGPLSENISACP